MPQFSLQDYETVEERIKRFLKDNSDGRIITDNLTTLQDRQVGMWVTRSLVYLNASDQEKGLPKASGLAFEIDSQKGPQATSGLEVCETSSIGRALANAGYSGNRRASRTEMEKVARGNTPKPTIKDWSVMADALGNDIEGLRLLYSEAKTGGATTATLDKIKAIANGLASKKDTDSVNP
ncbi:hypothetical protein UFOVP419_2 [uncultured Caudovirales phage]|uniref:Uncharacterized protein n=1 Tax=uncultured Caudovirales phage TaxID=2100421 RepID=A0A6J5M6L1_9CAUD|nr:hypothetical protein UFOVP419_2 [uncultured Caudovirales phage]